MGKHFKSVSQISTTERWRIACAEPFLSGSKAQERSAKGEVRRICIAIQRQNFRSVLYSSQFYPNAPYYVLFILN